MSLTKDDKLEAIIYHSRQKLMQSSNSFYGSSKTPLLEKLTRQKLNVSIALQNKFLSTLSFLQCFLSMTEALLQFLCLF